MHCLRPFTDDLVMANVVVSSRQTRIRQRCLLCTYYRSEVETISESDQILNLDLRQTPRLVR
jgi:hypothetical protein